MAKETMKKQFNKITKPTRTETGRQHVVGGQKNPIKITFQEAGPKKIWTF